MTQVDPEQWVRTYADELFRHALARVRQRQVAEDLVQETFLAAWIARDRFAGRSSEKTWLMRILRNKTVDHFRRQAREVSFADLDALEEFEASQFHPAFLGGAHWARPAAPANWQPARESVENTEFWKTLDRCIGKLPDRIAQVFLLRELEEWSSEEICDNLVIKRNHLFVLLHRARLALRHCLEQNWFRTPSDQEPSNNRP
jgi:RNA polymerase sigma-70 factor (ECF subfamily)